jgi:hypothetical protein
VSGEDVSGGGASGGATGDEAAWQELVARFDMPADWDAAVAPWPDREGLTAPVTPPAQDAPPGPSAPSAPPGPPGPPSRVQGTAADRTRVVRPATPPGPPWPPADPPASPAAAGAAEADDTDEHYVPPPPPPLPHLDPVAKGAWTGLFGGPAYLLIATIVGWVVPGWAALLAIAAFVAGFVVLVLRLGDGPSRGSGPDNGAVL